jgi:hypothetical protein
VFCLTVFIAEQVYHRNMIDLGRRERVCEILLRIVSEQR